MKMLKIVFITMLCSLCGAQSLEIFQPEDFKVVKLGQTVVLKCITNSFWRNRVWYKLDSKRRFKLLASTNNLFEQNPPFDSHYSVKSSTTENTLTIKDMTMEDVGTYYCGIHNSYDVRFGSGTVLEFEGESEPIQSVLQKPADIRAQPGDSVTLSCSFTSSLCPQEHTRVMWLRTGAASSEIVSWSYRSENNFCENTGETSCVYNLTLKDMSSADDGTYLCVVTACGDTLIGNTTRILLYEVDLSGVRPTVMALMVLNIVLGLAVIVLLWVICKLRGKLMKDSSQGSTDDQQADGEVTYARVNVVARSAPRRLTPVTARQDTVVYSEVK